MRRVILAAAAYLLFAVIGRFVEGMGARRVRVQRRVLVSPSRVEPVSLGLSGGSPTRICRLDLAVDPHARLRLPRNGAAVSPVLGTRRRCQAAIRRMPGATARSCRALVLGRLVIRSTGVDFPRVVGSGTAGSPRSTTSVECWGRDSFQGHGNQIQ